MVVFFEMTVGDFVQRPTLICTMLLVEREDNGTVGILSRLVNN